MGRRPVSTCEHTACGRTIPSRLPPLSLIMTAHLSSARSGDVAPYIVEELTGKLPEDLKGARRACTCPSGSADLASPAADKGKRFERAQALST